MNTSKILSIAVFFFGTFHAQEKNKLQKFKQYSINATTFVGSYLAARMIKQTAQFAAAKALQIPAEVSKSWDDLKNHGLYITEDKTPERAKAAIFMFLAGLVAEGLMYNYSKKITQKPIAQCINKAALASALLSLYADSYALIGLAKLHLDDLRK